MRQASSPSTYSRVTPYLKARGPPAFSATLPPIMQVFSEFGIGRVEEALGLDRRVEVGRDEARLHDGEEVLAIDLEDAAHRVGREHDAAGDRDGAARATGAAGARRHRDAVLLGDRERRGDVGRVRGEHDGVGHSPDGLALVRRVGIAPGLARVHLRRPEVTVELRERAVDGVACGQTNLGRCYEHPCFIALPIGQSDRNMIREGARGTQPKRHDDRWETLKRRVQLLARLEGHAVLLASGVHAATPVRVVDADRIVQVLRERGVLDRATFERALASERPPMAITREVLATAQRDLRALATQPALSLARERRRALARYGDVDEAWLKAKRAQVDMLAGAVQCSVPRSPEEWFLGVVDLVRLVHGARRGDARSTPRAFASTSLGAERRRVTQERIDALVTSLETGEPPAEPDLVPLAARLERARDLPGRARRTRVLDVLRKALAWPEAPAEAVADLAAPVREKSFALPGARGRASHGARAALRVATRRSATRRSRCSPSTGSRSASATTACR